MTYQLNAGRCEDVLNIYRDNFFDSIVTDPPYGLSFMGHKWDYQVPTVEQWIECFRVLKPGGYLLAFGGARTYHRLVVNIEDAGFEIRDQIMWLYGSGFPKSKNLTGEHQGKGTALKPAHEPIVMARKPMKGTVEQNVIEFGTGALNIDLSRIPTGEALKGGAGGLLSNIRDEKPAEGPEWNAAELGRWPANVMHDGSDDVISQFPKKAGAAAAVTGKEPSANGFSGSVSFGGMKGRVAHHHHGDEGSAARFFYCAKVNKTERDEGMERFIAVSASDMTGGRKEGSAGLNDPRAGAGRTNGARNNHPTVKPTELMRYLCRLVTPAGGTVLDPFMGSGSTGKAAVLDGFNFIGIELDADHLTTAAARIAYSFKKASEPKSEEPAPDAPDMQEVQEVQNKIWPAEVTFLFDQVPEAAALAEPLQLKIKHHINRLKLDGLPTAEIITTVVGLVESMGATS